MDSIMYLLIYDLTYFSCVDFNHLTIYETKFKVYSEMYWMEPTLTDIYSSIVTHIRCTSSCK